MGILSDFERRLERVIEGILARAFRGGVQPVELATRILREMEAGRTLGVRQVWVPNRYRLRLSRADRERFRHIEGALRRELEQVVLDGARERGWGLVGPPEVLLDTDPSLGEGELACEASLAEGPVGAEGPAPVEPTGVLPEAPPGEAEPPGELVLIEDGRPRHRYPLLKDRVTIGRLADSDIVLADPGVSRRHAEVRRGDGGFVILDLGSTNGTLVNGTPVAERRLEEGDRITVGRTVLEFRRR
jgi:hypothetical protein